MSDVEAVNETSQASPEPPPQQPPPAGDGDARNSPTPATHDGPSDGAGDDANDGPVDAEDGHGDGADDDGRESDVLSDIDDNVFEEEYNPDTARIEERDYEDIAKSLKAVKRKRPEGESASRKPREGRREKKRRTDKVHDADEVSPAPEGEVSGSRKPRKARNAADGARRAPKAKSTEPEDNEENLTAEQRRAKALARAMDAASKSSTKRRRKKDEVDLEEMADEEIAALKIRMENACVADNQARQDGKPAVEKLKLLPQVVSLLNRNSIQHAILDPETNFLQSVRFFLEPLNDGSLPGYNIQREIFSALVKLPIEKEALLSSGIGKVVLFYTKSSRPEAGVKRMAERLIGEWSRPILKRTDDYRKRHIQTRDFDYAAAKQAQEAASYGNSQGSLPTRPAGKSLFEAEIQRKLAPVANPNRARGPGLPKAYTIAPNSTFDSNSLNMDHRPLGAGGMEAFRKMTQKGKGGKRG